MITDILIHRTEGDISIRTATEVDKDDYIALELDGDYMQSLAKVGTEEGIDVGDIFWNERCQIDCIMFAIMENKSGKTVGFCTIEQVSSEEPTIGITLAEPYRGKGYGYLAAKMMIEEGWKIFDHPYFVWELNQDNIVSRRLVLKLGGKLINNRCVLSENMIKVMRENGIEINPEIYSASVERYKLERPVSEG